MAKDLKSWLPDAGWAFIYIIISVLIGVLIGAPHTEERRQGDTGSYVGEIAGRRLWRIPDYGTNVVCYVMTGAGVHCLQGVEFPRGR